MPKLPIKKTQKLAEAQEYGKTLGKLKALIHFKQTKKGWLYSIRQHIGRLIDKTKITDIMEITAVLGLTWIIKRIIDTTEDYMSAVYNFMIGEPPLIIRLFGSALEQQYRRIFQRTMDVFKSQPFEMTEWLVSFVIAYIIIKHGGQLLGLMREGMGTLKSLVGAFLTG